MISNILYFLIKNLTELMIYSFFREIHVIGKENLPKDGPVILCSTHNSQFVDGMMLIATCKRPVNFLIAEKSTRHKLLKYFLRFMNVVPVTRAIDHKKLGTGKIQLVNTESLLLKGRGTRFQDQIGLTDSIRVTVKVEQEPLPLVLMFKVDEVIDQETLRVKMSAEDLLSLRNKSALVKLNENEIELNVGFYILPKINQKKVFQGTLDALNGNKVIGIFPEGGSHDQTKLIDIKPGACIFQYKFFESTGRICPIIPVGINYFGSHKFRSKVVINIGSPVNSNLNKQSISKMTGKLLTLIIHNQNNSGSVHKRENVLIGRLAVQASQSAANAFGTANENEPREGVCAQLSRLGQLVLFGENAAGGQGALDRREIPHFQKLLRYLQEHKFERRCHMLYAKSEQLPKGSQTCRHPRRGSQQQQKNLSSFDFYQFCH